MSKFPLVDNRGKRIITHHEFPPIPIREFDWCAFFEGEEEAGNYGRGPTEQAAIADLLENRGDGPTQTYDDVVADDLSRPRR